MKQFAALIPIFSFLFFTYACLLDSQVGHTGTVQNTKAATTCNDGEVLFSEDNNCYPECNSGENLGYDGDNEVACIPTLPGPALPSVLAEGTPAGTCKVGIGASISTVTTFYYKIATNNTLATLNSITTSNTKITKQNKIDAIVDINALDLEPGEYYIFAKSYDDTTNTLTDNVSALPNSHRGWTGPFTITDDGKCNWNK